VQKKGREGRERREDRGEGRKERRSEKKKRAAAFRALAGFLPPPFYSNEEGDAIITV
jgi:hypothetical protein